MSLVLIIVVLLLYFLPVLIANKRRHHNTGAIFVVNLFLGWTFLGWVVALAMASGGVRRAYGDGTQGHRYRDL